MPSDAELDAALSCAKIGWDVATLRYNDAFSAAYYPGRRVKYRTDDGDTETGIVDRVWMCGIVTARTARGERVSKLWQSMLGGADHAE